MNGSQQGYLLLETAVLGVIILAMTACLRLNQQALSLEARDGARTTAIYLVREEFSRLEYEVDQGDLQPGKVGWLGDEADLMRNGSSFRVEAEVREVSAHVLSARVTAEWQTGGKKGMLHFERLLCRHEWEGAG